MLINGTLWVQIFNFWCFYWFFKRLFLKPAVKVVRLETDYKDLLKNEIDVANKEIRLQYEQQEKVLEVCRLEAENNKPDIFDLGIKPFMPQYVEPSKIEITIDKKAVVQDIKNLILESAHDS